MILFKSNYQPSNYKLEEIRDVLENGKELGYILRNMHDKTCAQIAKEMDLNLNTVSRRLNRIGIKKPNAVKFRNHQETVIILNMETGIYYSSFATAGETVSYNKGTFRSAVIRNDNRLKSWKIV